MSFHFHDDEHGANLIMVAKKPLPAGGLYIRCMALLCHRCSATTMRTVMKSFLCRQPRHRAHGAPQSPTCLHDEQNRDAVLPHVGHVQHLMQVGYVSRWRKCS